MHLIKKDYRPRVPYHEIQDGIDVYHPRFFNIPRYFKFLDGIFFFLSSILAVWKIRKVFDFDLVDAHFTYPDGVGAALIGKLFRRPVTITVREGRLRDRLKWPLISPQIRFAFRSAARIITVSRDLANAVIESGIHAEKVVVVPNGIDTGKFKRLNKLDTRAELGLPLDKKIVISAGWLVELKGFHRIISLLPRIKKKIPGLLFLIVGGPPRNENYEPALRQMVRDLSLEEDVIFAGARPHEEMHKWLSASDVFCLATSNEGWANVFLEAMACGLPIVTTRVGGNPEVVSSTDYGTLVEAGNGTQLEDALLDALERKWEISKITDYAVANSWDTRIELLLKEINKAAGLKRNRSCNVKNLGPYDYRG